MVPLLDFITANISYFISLGLNLLILIVSIYSYQRTKHNGFLLIGIGEFLTIIWLLFELFILQGVFFYSSTDFPSKESIFISSIIGFISIGLSILYTGLLTIALLLFSDKITRSSKIY